MESASAPGWSCREWPGGQLDLPGPPLNLTASLSTEDRPGGSGCNWGLLETMGAGEGRGARTARSTPHLSAPHLASPELSTLRCGRVGPLCMPTPGLRRALSTQTSPSHTCLPAPKLSAQHPASVSGRCSPAALPEFVPLMSRVSGDLWPIKSSTVVEPRPDPKSTPPGTLGSGDAPGAAPTAPPPPCRSIPTRGPSPPGNWTISTC